MTRLKILLGPSHYQKNLLDKIGIENDYSMINKMEVKDFDGTGKIVFKSSEIGMDHLAIQIATLLMAVRKKQVKKSYIKRKLLILIKKVTLMK